MYKFLLIVLYALLVTPLFSQSNIGLRSRLLTSYDGLSSDHVKQTLEDNNGMMWIATTKGLNRYDGKNVQRYRTSQTEGKGLQYDDIKTMLLTQSGEFLIGTQKGLVKKLKNDNFVKINNESLGSEVFPSDEIVSLLQDNQGYIWVATRQGIVILSPDLKNFHTYLPENLSTDSTENKRHLLPAGDVADMFQDKAGNVWISIWSVGLTLAIPSSNNDFKSYQFSTLTNYDLKLPGNMTFQKIFQDENNKLWLQAAFGIFYRLDLGDYDISLGLDPEQIKVEAFDFDRFDGDRHNVSICHYIDGTGLFVSTPQLSYLIPPHILAGPADANFEDITEIKDLGLGLDTKGDIFVDSRNIVWIASSRGVYTYFGLTNKIFTKLPSYQSKIQELNIYSIYHDKEGTWLGTDEGLFIDNQKELKEIRNGNNAIIGVTSFEKSIHGDLWIGTLYGELFQLKSKTIGHKIKKHSLPRLDEFKGNNHIWNILEVTEDIIWLATHAGVFMYNSSTTDLQKWRLPGFGDYDITFNCFDIVKDVNNRIYISATGFGLFIGTINKDGEYEFVHKKQGTTSPELSSNIVFDLEVDNDKVWIAQSRGVEVYNAVADSFYRIPMLDESVNGQVYSVASINNKIWCTTPVGLSCYSDKDQTILNFSSIDGAIDKHAMLGHFKDTNGNLYLAGAGGYQVIDPDKRLNKDISEELVFSNLSIASHQINIGEIDPILERSILTKELDQTKEITLSHLHKNVVINFSIQDFIKPHQYDYSYILKGISDDWINIGQEQKINFTQLPEENFELGIKAKDQSGFWSKPRFISIQVLTPFWKRPAYLIGIAFLSFVLIGIAAKYRERTVQRRNLLLENTVKQRTLKLVEQNQQLEEYIESNKNLESFAHAASHDLKSPLRNIASFSGLLKMKLKNKINEKEFGYLSEIEKGATRLNILVDDILTFSKLDSEKLNLQKHSISEIVKEVLDSLNTDIKNSNAKISFAQNDCLDEFIVDKIKISRVIQNLLANALKFVEEGRTPEIKILLKEDDQNHYILIKDNGIGISEKNQKEIFEMFKRVQHSFAYDGTGFGLSFSKKIMQLHNGDLQVSSEVKKGSTFTLTFSKKPKLNNKHNSHSHIVALSTESVL